MSKSKVNIYHYDDHTSIPFKMVHLKPVEGIVTEKAHRHNFFQLFFFTQTGGKHLVDFEEQTCREKEVHVVNPGSIHKLTRNSNTKGYVFLFSRTFIDQNRPNSNYFIYRNDFNKFINFTKEEFTQIENWILLIDKENKENSELKEKSIQALLELIIISVQRKITFEIADNLDSNDLLFNGFVKLVNLHFDREHQIQYYTSKLILSIDKLNSITKSRLNKTANQMLQERILLEAKRLLFHSSKSIKEIAFALGYEDPSYFNRFFKNKIEKTPLEFRKEIQEKYH